jgi:hypothetical protein
MAVAIEFTQYRAKILPIFAVKATKKKKLVIVPASA